MPRVEDRHRSREFVAFLKQLDAAYPNDTAIKLILDNHAAHMSKETKTWVTVSMITLCEGSLIAEFDGLAASASRLL